MDDETIKEELERIESKVDDIKDNHLQCLWEAVGSVWGTIEDVKKDITYIVETIKNLRWFIMGGFAVLAITVTLIQCFG